MRTTYQSHKMNFKFFLSNMERFCICQIMERYCFCQIWNVSVAFLIWTRLFLLNMERFWVFCISVVVLLVCVGWGVFCFFCCFFFSIWNVSVNLFIHVSLMLPVKAEILCSCLQFAWENHFCENNLIVFMSGM